MKYATQSIITNSVMLRIMLRRLFSWHWCCRPDCILIRFKSTNTHRRDWPAVHTRSIANTNIILEADSVVYETWMLCDEVFENTYLWPSNRVRMSTSCRPTARRRHRFCSCALNKRRGFLFRAWKKYSIIFISVAVDRQIFKYLPCILRSIVS